MLSLFDETMMKLGFTRYVADKGNKCISDVCFERSLSKQTSFFVEGVYSGKGVYYEYSFYKQNFYTGDVKLYCERMNARSVLYQVKKKLDNLGLSESIVEVPRKM